MIKTTKQYVGTICQAEMGGMYLILMSDIKK